RPGAVAREGRVAARGARFGQNLVHLAALALREAARRLRIGRLLAVVGDDDRRRPGAVDVDAVGRIVVDARHALVHAGAVGAGVDRARIVVVAGAVGLAPAALAAAGAGAALAPRARRGPGRGGRARLRAGGRRGTAAD